MARRSVWTSRLFLRGVSCCRLYFRNTKIRTCNVPFAEGDHKKANHIHDTYKEELQ